MKNETDASWKAFTMFLTQKRQINEPVNACSEFLFTLYNTLRGYIFNHLTLNSTTAVAIQADMELTMLASPANG